MSAMVLIVLGLLVATIYLLRVVATLQHRIHSLERNLDQLSYKVARSERAASSPVAEPPGAIEPTPAVSRTAAPEPVRVPVPIIPTAKEPILSPSPVPVPGPVPTPPLLAPADSMRPKPQPPQTAPQSNPFNWEQFLGAKLFAWLGGLALFVGIAFFVKYSFDRNLVPPWLRVALGFAFGIGLVVGGARTRKKEYLITAQTLVATGIVVLYGVSFITRSFYHLINTPILFLLMTSVTVAAFTFAIRMDARVIAVLGMLGGFLSPPLVHFGKEQPIVLFAYVLILDIGLLAVARQRQWRFLIPLAAMATVLTELGWVGANLSPQNLASALVMIGAITALFVLNTKFHPDVSEKEPSSMFGGVLQSLFVFGLAAFVFRHTNWGIHPAVTLSIIFFADVALLATYAITLHFLPLILAVSGTGAILSWWLGSGSTLPLGCTAAVIYGALNALVPAWISRLRGGSPLWPNIASVGGLGLLLLVLFRESDPGWIFWPAVLAANGVLLAVAFLRRSLLLAIAGSVGTAVLSLSWILKAASDQMPIGVLVIICLFAAIYFFLGGALARSDETPAGTYFPAVPAGVPFVLLALLIVRFQVGNPSLLFLAAAFLNVLLIYATPREVTVFPIIALGGSLMLESLWFVKELQTSNAMISLGWFILFSVAFTFFPFLKKPREEESWVPWYVSAAAGPLHFYLIFRTVKMLWPEMPLPGLIPAALGLPALAVFIVSRRAAPSKEALARFTAVFGASLSFFVTLIFPIQFDRQWLTIGWALEGAALLWLNRRAPAQWLVGIGSILLVTGFTRLALNLNVFHYQERSAVPVLNWYLYAYGTVAAALFSAARLSRGMENGKQLQGLFSGMGTILLFLLMNIEIADLFASGPYLTFDFSGNFARDMTYSIAWSLFALTLLAIGVRRDVPAVRYSAIALMGATLLKLFFHDLTRLDALFRIGAFIGVAIILIFASWLYQRFLSTSRGVNTSTPSA